jgi:Rrf2 family protein
MLMQFTITADYGIRVVLYLAQKKGVVNSNEICTKMAIPRSYMPKITRVLKNVGLLREVRGSMGGFVLQKSPDSISVLNIINAFEKTMRISKCLEGDKFCNRDAVGFCALRDIYAKTQTDLYNSLNIKLSTFLKQECRLCLDSK